MVSCQVFDAIQVCFQKNLLQVFTENEDGKTSKWNSNNRYDYVMYVSGLLCMSKDNVETARIWNPSTREVIRLPNLYNYSLGYEPEEKKFKFLMTQEFNRTRNWVFTLSIDEEWREIEIQHG